MRRVDGRILGAAGWDHQIHAAFQQWRGDHEYDEQHKSEIEQWSDIDLAQRGEALALRVTSHLKRPRMNTDETQIRKQDCPLGSLLIRVSSALICGSFISAMPPHATRDRRICAQTPMRAQPRNCPSPR